MVMLVKGLVYDRDLVSELTGVDCSVEPDMTKQEFREESDINTLVRRFHITGELPQDVRMPEYGDFTGISDYHSAVNAIAEAHEAFDAMPAELREKFQNDPGRFVAFCSEPGNLEEARRMGLVPAAELVEASPAAAGPATAPSVVAEPVATAGTLPT